MSTTLSAIGDLPDNAWVEEAFEVQVTGVEVKPTKKGGKFWVATISDETASASMSLFTPPKFTSGDLVRVSGKGVKKGSFNGNLQITTGKDATLEVRPGAARVQAAAHGAIAQKTNSEMINGQAVGNALSNAWEVARYIYSPAELAIKITRPDFWATLHAIASDHLRIGRMLESGNLADPVKTRGGARPNGGSTQRSSTEAELDEDVPF